MFKQKAWLLSAFVVHTHAAIAAADVKSAANDLCQCVTPPFPEAAAIVSQIRAAYARGTLSELPMRRTEYMMVMGMISQCLAALPHKYPEIDRSPELRSEVLHLAERQCPDNAQGQRF